MHGAYIEYDNLNFGMHNSTSTQVFCLIACADVHTEIEYIIFNIGTVR